MENNTGTINFPSVYMHTSPDIASEVSDELLYGTTVRKIGKTGDYFRCETDYGYSGYIHTRYIAEPENTSGASAFVVTAPFADLLTDALYKYRPVITLPRGSIIYSRHKLCSCDRFFPVMHRGHRCYIPTASVSPYEKYSESPVYSNTITAKKICDDALMYLGTPYRWGGKSTSGIDCSGLCYMSYFLNGLPLWRDSYADTRFVHEISAEKARQGDVIYFRGHVAIYIGDGEYVHSSASAGCVTVNSLHKSSIIYRADLAESFITFARSNLL